MLIQILTNRLVGVSRGGLGLLRLQPSRAFVTYAISTFTHAVVLGGLAAWMPGDYAGGGFSMVSGNGGIGNTVTPLGSQGGATTSEVFHFEMPAISAAEFTQNYKAPNYAELAAHEQESRVTAQTPVVSAIQVARQEADSSVTAEARAASIEEHAARTETTSSEIERKETQTAPEPEEAKEEAVELPAARNIAVAPAISGAMVVTDLAEKAREGEIKLEAAAADAIKVVRREEVEKLAEVMAPRASIEREMHAEPAEVEIERKQERAAPKAEATAAPENPAKLPVVRSIAAAPTVGEVEVELPAVQVANGRGQDGLGTGTTQGSGNGGASGKAGGDFDSLARSGPLNLSPVYPPEALAARIEGIVHVQFQVAADGSAKSATIFKSSGFAILDEAVLRVAKHYRFEPARRGGVPVECVVRLPFEFSLSRR